MPLSNSGYAQSPHDHVTPAFQPIQHEIFTNMQGRDVHGAASKPTIPAASVRDVAAHASKSRVDIGLISAIDAKNGTFFMQMIIIKWVCCSAGHGLSLAVNGTGYLHGD